MRSSANTAAQELNNGRPNAEDLGLAEEPARS
jgi:hypothetical protein